MNLYKYTFEVKDSANKARTITTPTDSKISVGIKVTDGGVEINQNSISIQLWDDEYIYEPNEIFNNYAVFAIKTDSTQKVKEYKVKIQGDEINADFTLNVKTTDSNISPWAITDSQMKIVYEDEWEEKSETADPRTIYFVVSRPPEPTPVPKPGSSNWAIGLYMADEDATFNPTDPVECLNKAAGQYVTYERDGQTYYVHCNVDSSPTAGKVDEMLKVDKVGISLGTRGIDPNFYAKVDVMYFKDGKVYYTEMNKPFDGYESAREYVDSYYASRFGEDGNTPNTSNPLPDDFDEYTIKEPEFGPEQPTQIVDTDTYIWFVFDGDEEGYKLFKNANTFIEWIPDEGQVQ